MAKQFLSIIWIYFSPSLIVGDELKMVHAVWRHGDRSPASLIPTDVNNTAASWPQGLGELSPTGMRQEFQLGQTLSQRYSGTLVSVNYSQPQIYVRSDDYNRTLMSAQANLAGFYRNSTSEVSVTGWPAAYWQPIPVHTISLAQDNLISTDMDCPKIDQIMSDKVMQSDEYKASSKYFQPLFDYLTSVCGYGYPVTLDNIGDVFDPLNSELAHYDDGHRWPNYINGSIFELIRQANNINWDFSYSDPTIARLRGGNLLSDIVSRMQQKQTSLIKMNDTSLNWVRRLKYYMYSAHDTTVNAFLSTLGAERYTGGQPGYSACVLLELWATEKNIYYVKTFYRQNVSDDFFEIQVKDCPPYETFNCSLNEFYRRSVPFIPTNWGEECAISSISRKFAFQGISLLFASLFVSFHMQILTIL